MQGYHYPARAVIVYDQIMDSEDVGIAEHNGFNPFYKGFLRRLSKQGADGIFRGGKTGIEYEDTYQKAAPAIDMKAGKFANQGCCKHNGCGEHVAEAVRRCCQHGGTGDFLPC